MDNRTTSTKSLTRPIKIIKNPAGVKPEHPEKIELLDASSVFVNNDMIQMIVTWTNQSIKQSLSICKQSASDKNVAHLYETNEREMKAFSGLQYICGLLNWNNNDITFAYSQIYGNKIFNTTMSVKCFRFLCANLPFDDISSRNTRFQHDRAAAIRDLFEYFARNCEKGMHPDMYLSLDETLYPTRVVVAFCQYNKDKLAKYGLLFQSINSAEVPYTYTSVISADEPVDKPGPYIV